MAKRNSDLLDQIPLEESKVAVLGNELIQYRTNKISDPEVFATLNLRPEGVKVPMTLLENKILLYLISRQDPSAQDGKLVKVRTSVRELAAVLGYSSTNDLSGKVYKNIRKALLFLRYRVLILKYADGRESFISWIRDNLLEWKGAGEVEIELEPKLAPFLIGLHGNFTQILLEYVTPMQSRYSLNLYLHLKSVAHRKGKYYLELGRLMDVLVCEGESYKAKFSDFEKRVLRPAIGEINQITDLTVFYEPVKAGRSIQGVSFEVRKQHGRGDLPKAKTSELPASQAGACREAK